MSHPQNPHEELEFPPWVAGIFGLIALATCVAVVHQRSHEGQGLMRPALLAGLVMFPYVVEVAAFLIARRWKVIEGFLRTVMPRFAFVGIVFLGAALLIVRPAELDFAPFILVFLAAQTAAEADRWPGIAVALAGIALMVGVEVFGLWEDSSLIWTVGIVLGWFGGFSVHATTQRALELKRAYAQLEEAQAGLAEKAAAEERSRIAREVHDVIAHSLSVTMLHVTAARMALQKGSDEPALESLQEAEKQGRKSLAEIRRTVGLLGPDADATASPMPGAGDLASLVEDFKGAGVDVSLRTSGNILALSPATGLSLYRIVQESLTNVAKHAPGARASVELTLSNDDIRLRVHNAPTNGNPPQSDGGGLGIRGMIERASVLDGTLAAGPDDGGWTVFLRAPRPADTNA